jgi:osmotically-inducible protein OsmY
LDGLEGNMPGQSGSLPGSKNIERYSMPEFRTKEVETRLVHQGTRTNLLGPEVRATDCLDIHQVPADWQVVEAQKSSNEGFQAFFALSLQPGHRVYCRDGYVGKVTALNLNPPDNIHSFVVEIGRIFRRKMIVPYQCVVRIEPENVYILGGKGDLKRLPEVQPDSTLIREVDRTLRKDTVLRRTVADQIHVLAQGGVISLEGYVSNSAQKTRAEEATRRIPGVIEVQNCLVVDDNLKIAAAGATAKIPLSYRERIFVGAHNGFIILNGEVSTVEARMDADAWAGDVPQIRGVINGIRVPDAGIEFPEPRALQPRIGAGVYAKDMALGTVERVIVNPVNRLVVAILVDGSFPDPKDGRTHWFPGDGALVRRKVVIPIHAIRHLTDTAVFLEINSIEASRLEDFDPDGFALPETSWRTPYPYHCEDVLLRGNHKVVGASQISKMIL